MSLRCALALVVGLLPATAAAQQTSTLGPLGQAAAQRGIRTCLPTIDALGQNLAQKHSFGVYLFNTLTAPDSNLVSVSLELTPSPSGGPFYLSATFVPSPAGTCQALVEATITWASNCVAVGLAYPGYQVTGQLLNDIRILAAKGPERLFLLPTANGCISIEKSVYF